MGYKVANFTPPWTENATDSLRNQDNDDVLTIRRYMKNMKRAETKSLRL